MHRFNEMSHAAIAREFGISVSAVEKHIATAVAQLMIRLRSEADA